MATAKAMARAKEDGKHRYVHAFPSVENLPSNAICRKLGFEFLGEHDLEFPPGQWIYQPCKCTALLIHSPRVRCA